MPPIFLFALAGALLFGGVATLDEANQKRAAEELRRRKELEAELLRGAIDLQQLRQQAREAGLDPDQVVSGYEAMRKGDITIHTMQQMLTGSV